jgi:putative endonuclease
LYHWLCTFTGSGRIAKKIKLLVEAVDHFVQSRELDVEVRFDLITYVFDGTHWEQNHITDAFYPFG